MVAVLAPLLPGMAHKINNDVEIGTGLVHLFSFNWLYGFVLSIVLYVSLHYAFPHKETSIPALIPGTVEILDGAENEQ